MKARQRREELARVTAARAKVDKLGERLLADLKRERDKGALSSPRKEALLVWETVFDAARGAAFADAPASTFERAGSYVAKVHANLSKASGSSPRLSAKAGPHRATRELHIAVGRRVSRLVRLLILGAAVYLCACLYFASYGDTASRVAT